MWTDEKKAQVIEMYTKRKPTPETSVEIVKEIAEEMDETPNGVRMVLSKAEVYVKKDPSAVAKKEGTGGGGKGSKPEAFKALTDAINDAGQSLDTEIIEKLTGKAALYFAGVIRAITK